MTTTPTTGSAQTVRDEHGLPIAAPPEAAALYDKALDRLVRYHPDVLDLATELSERHGDVAMTNAFLAYLNLSSSARSDVDAARAAWEAMAGTPMGPREHAHHDAIGAWVQGDWHGAARTLDDLLERWPADLLALMCGHLLDFYVGDAANLRDRPGRSLGAIDPDHPHAAFVRGMQAFGLEESGHYEAAEDAGLSALSVNPDDVWAVHAVTHTYEMRGRAATGVDFLTSREGDWGSGNLFTVHNWWHLALFHLELGDPSAALAIYDREIHHEASAGVPLELLDATAMLWRLHLDGIDTGARFPAVADAWSNAVDAERWYAFNDVHAVLAYVGAGRLRDAEELVEQMAGYVNGDAQGPPAVRSNVAMTVEIGLPVSRALVAYGRGDWSEVVSQLAPIRRRLHVFGGSHAQRDVVQRTLLDAALRDGRLDLARALVAERLAVRPNSEYAARQQARLAAASSG